MPLHTLSIKTINLNGELAQESSDDIHGAQLNRSGRLTSDASQITRGGSFFQESDPIKKAAIDDCSKRWDPKFSAVLIDVLAIAEAATKAEQEQTKATFNNNAQLIADEERRNTLSRR